MLVEGDGMDETITLQIHLKSSNMLWKTYKNCNQVGDPERSQVIQKLLT